ncbi:uncharacterized protein BT62DRAFT_1012111 [Guyanagaster necrorhizus]|uniref:Uncharacterized protein n=1 Tax=Guyanagaster necrorhizus TaxID=856835 RepID=A0A9P7VI06_9AGAR|nr:uncharacterized protein BT62DRAFT_1012111 [Guyanagaster necrorhizus MCA 3950]KAG7441069.1 hypothetical protein BT62DRAFT_1012111 [Guyanagaster necrorhizus MCA 3950]
MVYSCGKDTDNAAPERIGRSGDLKFGQSSLSSISFLFALMSMLRRRRVHFMPRAIKTTSKAMLDYSYLASIRDDTLNCRSSSRAHFPGTEESDGTILRYSLYRIEDKK